MHLHLLRAYLLCLNSDQMSPVCCSFLFAKMKKRPEKIWINSIVCPLWTDVIVMIAECRLSIVEWTQIARPRKGENKKKWRNNNKSISIRFDCITFSLLCSLLCMPVRCYRVCVSVSLLKMCAIRCSSSRSSSGGSKEPHDRLGRR